MRHLNIGGSNYGLKISAQLGCIHSLIFFRNMGGNNIEGALKNAARFGHIDIVKQCVKWRGIRSDEFTKALQKASFYGRYDVVEFLLEWTDSYVGYVDDGFRFAIAGGHTDIARLYIEKGARDFQRALVYATGHNYIEAVRVCKECGFDEYLDDAMAEAAHCGHIEIVKRCKQYGAVDYNEAIKWAAAKGHIQIVKLLQSWGADDFVIAAQEAAKYGHVEILILFKEWGLKDFDNAIKKAAEKGQYRVLKMLRELDVARASTDFYGYTKVACSPDIVRMLFDWQKAVRSSFLAALTPPALVPSN